MRSQPRYLNLLYSASCLSMAILLNFLANGCGQQDKPISPASDGNEVHQPYTFYSPSPADGAAEIGERVSFGWQYDNPDNIPMQYEVYMGTDSLIKVFGPDTVKCYTPQWGKQAHTKEMLVQIFEMQRAYRTNFNCYASNGVCASAAAPNSFFWTLGIVIDLQDRYTYTMASACNTFTCTAAGQLDYSNPEYDMWTIEENGELSQILHEGKLEFMPFTEYIWQVVAVDSSQNRIESPVWHFTTTPNALYPGNLAVVPCLPYPNNNFDGKLFTDYICWYGGTLSDSLSFDFYLGLGDNLQLIRQNMHESIFAPDWYRQKNMVESLNDILRFEISLKEQGGCYRGNGARRIHDEFSYFDSTCLQGVWFSRDDDYIYTVSATCSTFTVTATTNLDDDASLDTWTVDQTGSITCVINDADIPYRLHGRYSWKIVVRDSQNNVIEGPVWHFTANFDLGTPF